MAGLHVIVVIQALNLAGAARVSEAGLCELALACGGLHTLNMTGCESVTVNGLHALVEGLKYVKPAATFFGFDRLLV